MEKRVDKVAENDLLKQVKAYVLDGRFDKASEVIAQMDVNRIKAAPGLCLIGEVYMREKMYEDAESVIGGVLTALTVIFRSEERRVGKECRL